MRLIFAGTPAAAVPSLRALAASSHTIATVVTRPDAPIGRKRVLTPSPVAATADELQLPTLKTRRLDPEASAHLEALDADLGVIVAYGGLVREPLLSAPRLGWINLHFSLLPRWRGAAPVQHALIAGDAETGSSVFRLVAELDAGDVYSEVRYRVPPLATAADVLRELSIIGAEQIVGVVDALAAGTAVATPQAGTPTPAPKLDAADGRLDVTQPADVVLGRFRGVTPEPGAHLIVDGQRLKVLAAHRAESTARPAPGQLALQGREVVVGTADDAIALERVQPAGKAAMVAGDWWRGLRVDELRVEK